jgi:hypothetical protein
MCHVYTTKCPLWIILGQQYPGLLEPSFGTVERVLRHGHICAPSPCRTYTTTRYSDENNYYYLVARSSNVVSLRKLVNGEIVELDRADFTVTPGAWYRLRLEAVGDQLRGYVNDVLRVEATDSSLASGISGIATYRTAARIDFFRVFQP